MRLAGTAKLGFYPIEPAAIRDILKHLKMPDAKAEQVNIIDPCAGEGLAIRQIRDGLGVATDRTYAVELDAGRVAQCRENLPGGNVCGPASFLGVQITGHSFGLAYVNPPFDDEIGGGRREEQAFVERASRLLVPKGVLVLVAPLKAVAGNRKFCVALDSSYEDIRVYKLRPEVRHYNEIVLIGRKRKEAIPESAVYSHGCLHKMEFNWRTQDWDKKLPLVGDLHYRPWVGGKWGAEEPRAQYVLPWAWKPNTFRKITFTEEELAAALAASPLNQLLSEYVPPPPARPPLPLNKGHVGQLLASGMLDGVVETPYGPHVVRGTSKKVEYISGRSSTENEETGSVTEKVIYSQKVVLTIRAVGEDGAIKTFSDQPPPDAGDEEDTNEGRDGDLDLIAV